MTLSTIGQVKERLGERFELVAPLADAGLAEAWRALDQTNRKSKLVKVFRPTARSPEAWSVVVARLRRMGNPRVPKVVEAGETPDGRRWVAYEPVKGRSLANWLEGHRQAGSAPGLGVALRVFNDAAAALQVGHGMPAPAVIHRGFSPLSLILERSSAGYQVALLDHEIAPFLGTDDTRSFKAPELLDPAGRPSAASDVFALAVVWLNLVAMRPLPHEGSPETWAAFVVRAPKAVKAHLASLRTDVPRDVWAVVEEALQPEAARRPQDANSLATKLRKAAPDAWRALPQIEAEPPVPTRVVASVVPRDPRAASGGAVERWVAAERSPQEPAGPQHQTVPPVAGQLFVPAARYDAPPETSGAVLAAVGTSTLVDAFVDEPVADFDPTATLPDSVSPVEERPSGPGRARALPERIEQLVSRRKSAPAEMEVPAVLPEQRERRVGAETPTVGSRGTAHGWAPQAAQVAQDINAPQHTTTPGAAALTLVDARSEELVATMPLAALRRRVGGDTLDLADEGHDFAGAPPPGPVAILPVVASPAPKPLTPLPPPEGPRVAPIARPSAATGPYIPPPHAPPASRTPALAAALLLGALAVMVMVAFALLRTR